MSGHSKWHSIKHKKAAIDAKRGKLFTKIIKELTVAAKMGGGDPVANPRLRTAILAAKDANMPKDTLEKAVKKGAGELPGVSFEDSVYEGYGPGGVAVFVEVSTDNKNRTAAEIRHVFTRHGGSLGAVGCVAWMFTRKGVITIPADQISEEKLMEVGLEAGADDLKSEEDTHFVYTNPTALHDVRAAIEAQGIKVSSGEVRMLPTNTVRVEGKEAEQIIRLMETLEDHEDVTKVSANFDIPDEVFEKIGS